VDHTRIRRPDFDPLELVARGDAAFHQLGFLGLVLAELLDDIGAEILIEADDLKLRLAGQQLVSGMPAEIFMRTGSRTMMSYLLKPITDQLQRAFVER